MIRGDQYIVTVKAYFGFLITEFNFKISGEEIRGNVFYNVQYKDKKRLVSVSYENIEDYLQIIIFMLHNGELPVYDDKTKTSHLYQLNEQVLSRVDKREIRQNNECFLKFNAKDGIERKLIKSAKELRLCLKHFDELKIL